MYTNWTLPKGTGNSGDPWSILKCIRIEILNSVVAVHLKDWVACQITASHALKKTTALESVIWTIREPEYPRERILHESNHKSRWLLFRLPWDVLYHDNVGVWRYRVMHSNNNAVLIGQLLNRSLSTPHCRHDLQTRHKTGCNPTGATWSWLPIYEGQLQSRGIV